MNDFRYACRSFRQTPLASLTMVGTLGLGLGLLAAVFTVLNAFVFRVDDVQKPAELFAVSRQRSANDEPERFTRAQYDALIRETDAFSDTFATTSDVAAWIDGRRREGRLVTGNFFRLLGVTGARGRTLTPKDDEPGGHRVVVLSHRAWTQQFSSDPGIVGRTLVLNGARFDVVGVTPDGFRGLEPVAAPDFWAPLSAARELLHKDLDREPSTRVDIVGRLKPGLSSAQAVARLLAWDARRTDAYSADRLPSLTLEPRTGTVPLSREVVLAFAPLFFAFGLVLAIACANVTNFLLARAVVRQREIGIRLAIGASRTRIVAQLLTEGLLLALMAAGVGLAVSRLALAGIAYGVTVTFPPEIGDLRIDVPPADWRLLLFLAGGAGASTVVFALAPALQATRLDLVRAIRGEVTSDARLGRARHALITLQVTGSVLLFVCAAVFLRSSWAAAAIDPGIRVDGVVTVTVLNEQRRRTILDALALDPHVATVSATWPGFPAERAAATTTVDGASGTVALTYQYVSREYFGVLGIDIVRGRAFADTEQGANDAVAIVSESVARTLWPGREAVGRTLRLDPTDDAHTPSTDHPMRVSRQLEVVGIAREVAGIRLGGVRMGGAGVYVPVGTQTPSTMLAVRVRGNAARAREALIERLASIDPDAAEVSTLHAIARAEVYLLGLPYWLTLVLGSLTLVLTMSGLFSVVSYLVQQRTKELGVRMALGATGRTIAVLVLAQSAIPVGIGLLLGGTLAGGLAAVLLTTPMAGALASTIRLLDPAAYLDGVVVVVSACAGAALIPALRAARIDPIAALRRD